ncbi:uncharacterized protein LAESUDRAFT_146098 [Laetiporus sulphureus 93-53]|uniref:C2H2-type domain-containing protein n=1 Tax=Laetiporus sulphureus 93-53 TaxID=1314785 RepID=A0A165EAZ1_9APHY|nr:uncharacterized protein LAESUDRAFT_146098 [Laetiporus sulphureus 93-53]KZT06626.1 hypothetical protein LAESUDRAFT_146098 [Laetiporus sulphureus 93-53]
MYACQSALWEFYHCLVSCATGYSDMGKLEKHFLQKHTQANSGVPSKARPQDPMARSLTNTLHDSFTLVATYGYRSLKVQSELAHWQIAWKPTTLETIPFSCHVRLVSPYMVRADASPKSCTH